MVYAELMHNPYLLKTKVCFNGQGPKINSQIEKYENQTLKNWVDLVPGIFYDEMNGYDFDFNFTGTKSDFEEVQKAFKKAGVKTDEVRLFFKNELEDAEVKSMEIDALLCWLKEHRNRRFNWDIFWDTNKELFDSRYPYIVIGGGIPGFVNKDIVIENVKSEEELKGTILTNTPILFLVDDTSMKPFRQNLVKILSRKDISQKQLFFLFDDSVQEERTKRIILDLGVDSFGDPNYVEHVLRYVQLGFGNLRQEPNFDNLQAWGSNNPYSKAGLYGECTWFAWGRFYEIYGYDPGFTGDGWNCVEQLVAAHPDKFEISDTPVVGAIFSGVGVNHVGIIVGWDGINITIQEGNLDSKTNCFAEAKKDWQTKVYTLEALSAAYGGVVFAVHK